MHSHQVPFGSKHGGICRITGKTLSGFWQFLRCSFARVVQAMITAATGLNLLHDLQFCTLAAIKTNRLRPAITLQCVYTEAG